MMKVVCAWCKRDMGQKLGPDGLTTHGICRSCRDEIDRNLARLNDELDIGKEIDRAEIMLGGDR